MLAHYFGLFGDWGYFWGYLYTPGIESVPVQPPGESLWV